MIGSLAGCGCVISPCGCNGYGSWGVYGRTSRKSPLYVWKAKCEGARAAKDAGKNLYDSRNVDKQIGEWCSREAEWKEAERQRQAETVILEQAGQDVSLDLPSVTEVVESTKSGPPILPILAFLAIAGIGGFIIYRRGK